MCVRIFKAESTFNESSQYHKTSRTMAGATPIVNTRRGRRGSNGTATERTMPSSSRSRHCYLVLSAAALLSLSAGTASVATCMAFTATTETSSSTRRTVPAADSLLFRKHHCGAAEPPLPPCRIQQQRSRRLPPLRAKASSDGGGGGDDDGAVLTDVDARVLQEMLKSEKLDLQKQENMKKLLERGIKSAKGEDAYDKKGKAYDDEEETEFASEVMKKLGNTKLWKAFSRKAEDWLESAGVALQNRIERDAKLLASLGIFAFDRALQDVQRALPAVARVVQYQVSKTPLLGSTSSFQNVTKAATRVDSIRDDMKTPLDELKSIQQDLKDIFSAADTKTTSTGTDYSRRRQGTKTTLRSAAPSNKFSRERFQKAYQKQKETKLRREKENVAQQSGRIASGIVDSAWQVKRELEIEPNKPGYKTKALREAASASANLLAEGATRFLGSIKKQDLRLPDTATPPSAEAKEEEADAISGSAAPFFAAEQSAKQRTVYSAPEAAPVPSSTPSSSANPVQLQVRQQEFLESLQSELIRIVSELEYLVDRPDESWMDPDLIADQVDALSETTLEAIVTQMLRTQRYVSSLIDQHDATTTVDELLEDCSDAKLQLQVLFDLVDTETPQALAAMSEYFQRQLVFGSDHREEEFGLPILLKLDTLEREWKILQEEIELESMKPDFYYGSPMEMQEEEDEQVEDVDVRETELITDEEELLQRYEMEAPVSSTLYGDDDYGEVPGSASVVAESSVDTEEKPSLEIMDVITEAVVVPSQEEVSSFSSSTAQDIFVDYDGTDEPMTTAVAAEVVSDDEFDFEDTANKARTVEAVDEEEEQETSRAVQLGLRTLDVLFLVVEKGFTVRNPFDSGNANESISKVKNRSTTFSSVIVSVHVCVRP